MQNVVANKLVKGLGIAVAAALVITLSWGVAPAQAQTAADKQAEANDALARLSSMQETLDSASAAYFQALSEYQTAVSNRDAAQARINEIDAEIDSLQGRMGNRARDMYRGGPSGLIDLLLGSESLQELTSNWDLLNKLNENDAEMVQQEKDLKDEAEAQRAEFEAQAAVAQQKSDEAAEAYAQAEALVAEMQATYDALSAEAQALYAQEAMAQYAAAGEATNVGYQNDDGTVTDAATGAVYASAAEYTAATGNYIVDRARTQIGSNYVWGGVGGSWGGYDCSGFVSWALTGQNVRLGTTLDFMNWNQASSPYVGAVAVNEGHTGIVSRVDADGTVWIVHAINESMGVQETPITNYGNYIYVDPPV